MKSKKNKTKGERRRIWSALKRRRYNPGLALFAEQHKDGKGWIVTVGQIRQGKHKIEGPSAYYADFDSVLRVARLAPTLYIHGFDVEHETVKDFPCAVLPPHIIKMMTGQTKTIADVWFTESPAEFRKKEKKKLWDEARKRKQLFRPQPV